MTRIQPIKMSVMLTPSRTVCIYVEDEKRERRDARDTQSELKATATTNEKLKRRKV